MVRKNPGADRERIRYAIGETSLGYVLIAASAAGLCALFLDDDPNLLTQELHRRFRGAELMDDADGMARTLADVTRLVDHPSEPCALPLDPRGTPFQQEVWQALREIPAGSTDTYAGLARRIGRPSAARAVGAACSANPISVIIPCHRVLRGDGSLNGYRWGLARKRALLEREGKA